MKSPEEKYQSDSLYRTFVDVIEQHLNNAVYSPSEVREMSMLACIHYEQHRPGPRFNFMRLTDEFIEEEARSLKNMYLDKENKE